MYLPYATHLLSVQPEDKITKHFWSMFTVLFMVWRGVSSLEGAQISVEARTVTICPRDYIYIYILITLDCSIS